MTARRGVRGGADSLAIAAIIAACVGGAVSLRLGCGARAAPGACKAILDRYVAARVRQLDPKPSASAIAASVAASEREAVRTRELTICDETLRADAAACALGAGDADAMERCLQ